MNVKNVKQLSIILRVIGIVICIVAISFFMVPGFVISWVSDVLIEIVQTGVILLLFGHLLIVYYEFVTDKPPKIV
ncbi:MAG: hypothetical protein RTU30_05530, partial [Candidatus Thorarchaeota archaeon]